MIGKIILHLSQGSGSGDLALGIDSTYRINRAGQSSTGMAEMTLCNPAQQFPRVE